MSFIRINDSVINLDAIASVHLKGLPISFLDDSKNVVSIQFIGGGEPHHFKDEEADKLREFFNTSGEVKDVLKRPTRNHPIPSTSYPTG